MRNLLLAIFLLVITVSRVSAQRYLIKFKNKAFSEHTLSNPASYLSSRAIERRLRFSIPLDSTDLPVTSRYIDSLQSVAGVTILNASKWLNQVSIQVTDQNALTKINSFPFVFAVNRIATRVRTTQETVEKFVENQSLITTNEAREESLQTDLYNYGNSSGQVRIHNGNFLHNLGLRGENIIIGMLDAGYKNFNVVSSLDSARTNGQFLGTWDFVARENSVSEDDAHGMQCLTTIAANLPGTFVGTAPKASFYLFRTEEAATEYLIEEHNWVCGAERLDSAGGDLISSSLGYYHFDDPTQNHGYADMNGNTTIAAIGADLAAKKGVLVLNSAGNEGNTGWRYIITPADADSILAVGAVNVSGQVASFSSYGPTADGRIKPDVASVGAGTTVQNPNGSIGGANGTSFSCPNLAGLAACLVQGFPELNNMTIINAIRLAGSTAANPNNRIGYGIPDMKKALMQLLKDYASSQVNTSNCISTITWKSKDAASMKYEIERKASNETAYKKIADFAGSGVTLENNTYEFVDTLYGLPAGVVTYRIKQIIDTAAAEFTADYIDSVSTEASGLCALNNLDVLLENLKTAASSTLVVEGCSATLTWTSSDISAMRYEVERKGPGETLFSKVAEQNGTGTAFTQNTYTIVDNLEGLSGGMISYRIRQVVDTSFANFKADYIDTISREIIPSCNLTETITITPNPTNGKFVVQTTIKKPIEHFNIKISSASGQTISIIRRIKAQGITNFEIDGARLSKGVYFISIYDKDSLIATRKLLKL